MPLQVCKALTIRKSQGMNIEHCWNSLRFHRVPISRYRQLKASHCCTPREWQLTYDDYWRCRYQCLYYHYLLQSNYKTWGKAYQTNTSLGRKDPLVILPASRWMMGKSTVSSRQICYKSPTPNTTHSLAESNVLLEPNFSPGFKSQGPIIFFLGRQ